MKHLIILTVFFAAQAFGATIYRVELSGANEVPAVSSAYSGSATLVLNDDQTELSVFIVHNIPAEMLDGAPGAHIHLGSADENGPVLFAFDSPESPINATWNLTADDLAALENRELYINVHSTTNPSGELRGQITGGLEAIAWDVTVTNVTKSQIFSPPIAVSHHPSLSIFTPGQQASTALAVMAEDGNAQPLFEDVLSNQAAFHANINDGPVLPGGSVTFQVYTAGRYDRISVLGMLVTTNDAFFAARGIDTPRVRYFKQGQGAQVTTTANVYDAGSEANTEDCAHIPGPPCGNGGVRVLDGAEGYVYISNGISGEADLSRSVWHWNNPGAVVTVTLAD